MILGPARHSKIGLEGVAIPFLFHSGVFQDMQRHIEQVAPIVKEHMQTSAPPPG